MISSAATLFYGRRSRNLRSFDDLGFGSSSSSSPSDSTSNSQNHRHPKDNSRRRHSHNSDLGAGSRYRRPPSGSNPSNRSPVAVTQPHGGCLDKSTLQNLVNREATDGMSGRHDESNRLPVSVLLARERLLHRLRGESASEIRDCGETLASVHRNHFRLVDSGGFIVHGEVPTADTIMTESPPGAHQQSTRQVPNKKPLGLTMEIISQLHHEVFRELQKDSGSTMSKTLKECSICLENFVEGNELLHLDCGHKFHTKCLYPWLQSCGECPYCRSCTVITS